MRAFASLYLAVPSAAALLLACGGSETSDGTAAAPKVSSHASAICLPQGPSATVAVPVPTPAHGEVDATAPSSFYGCNDRFTVTITGTAGLELVPYVTPRLDSLPQTQFACESTYIAADVYGLVPATRGAPAHWTRIGQPSLFQSVWLGDSCVPISLPVGMINDSPYPQIMVAAKVYQRQLVFFPTIHTIEVDLPAIAGTTFSP